MDKAVTSNITCSPPLAVDAQVSLATSPLPKPLNDDAAVRHCAFCLQLCSLPVNICDGCHKRAYCSEECQKKDWLTTNHGQHHKNWCNIQECGEEDIDWEVVPVPDKGLGIVAKKFIPTSFKIMVEAVSCKPEAFRGRGPPEGPQGPKALRLPKINHGCRPNANYIFDDGAQVCVVYALQDIQPGDEIVFSLLPFTKIDEIRPDCKSKAQSKSLEVSIKERDSLLLEKGIVCPPDCYCKDRQVWELAREGNVLSAAYAKVESCPEHRDIERAIEIGEKLLDIEKRLNNSLGIQACLHCSLFNLIAFSKNKEMLKAKALLHLEAGTKILRSIIPYSPKTRLFEMFSENPEAALDYILHIAETKGFNSIFADVNDD